jgi:hypothetical protein
MLERTSKRPRRAAAIAGVALAMAMALGAAGARAEDAEDENVPLDTKLWRQFMKDLGLQRDGQAIDYHERAPLVVPPSRDLPPPRSDEEVAEKTPAWPKDPDVSSRKQAAAAEKARLKGNVSVEEQMRALRPDELDKPGRAAKGTAAKGDAKGAGPTAEDNAKPLMPSELGTDAKKIFGSIASSFSSAQPETEPFTGEPQRDSMTAPPSGYQTPSPNYPYGMGIQPDKRKASTLEERVEPH